MSALQGKSSGAPAQAFPGAAVLGAFFLSGACGLVHEVVWARLLRHVMGSTTFTVTTVLCAFMGGLALGSFLAGRLIDRRGDPLKVFSVLEGAVGLYCLLLPLLIHAGEPVYAYLYQHTKFSFYALSLVRFLFSGLILLVPATFMGATLPVLSRFFARSPEKLGWSIGTLYAVNTFGAVLGASLSGFLLIPALGVSSSLIIACCFNLAVSAGVFLAASRLQKDSGNRGAEAAGRGGPAEEMPPAVKPDVSRGKRKKKRTADVERPTPVTPPSGIVRVNYGRTALVSLLIGYGFAGFASMVYEIAWTRALSLLIGSTVYAFSMMLTAFVLGIALGSAVCARFVDRLRDPLRALAFAQVGIGLSAVAVVPVIGNLPFVVTGLISGLLDRFWMLQFVEFSLVLAIMFVPAALMGAAFPMVNRIYNQDAANVGHTVGAVYSSNTLGTIVGSFTGGFLLIPILGVQHSIFIASAVNVAVGIVFALACTETRQTPRWIQAGAAAVVLAAAIAFVPPWDPSVMSFGPLHEALRLSNSTAQSRQALEDLARKARVILHKDGLSTTVTVKEFGEGVRALYVNGKPDASSLMDLPSQEMVAHIPMLLHAAPENALVIGLASGISLGSVGAHPVKHLDCVEIAPEMVPACRLFDQYNHHILDDPRVSVILNDGRNHLALTDRRYDVIVSQPSNPFLAGAADLFTLEFFRLCRERLNSDGIMCSWIQGYSIGLETFQSILHTFQTVFPDMTLWRAGKMDLLLVGFKNPARVDYAKLAAKFKLPDVAADLQRIDIRAPMDFLAHFVMGPDHVRELAGSARLHTDDNALVEFAAPRALSRNLFDARLLSAIENERETGYRLIAAGPEELPGLEREMTRRVEARGHIFRAHLFLSRGDQQAAIEELRAAGRLNPTDPMLRDFNNADHKRANQLASEGRIPEAMALYRQMIDIAPGDERAHYNLATLLKRKGDYAEALAHFRRAAELKPTYTLALFNAGDILERAQQRKEAAEAYEKAIASDGEFVPALANLSRILAFSSDPTLRDMDRAVLLAEKAAKLASEEDVPLALDSLSAVYGAAGRYREAGENLEKAMNLMKERGDSATQSRYLADATRRLDYYRGHPDSAAGQ